MLAVAVIAGAATAGATPAFASGGTASSTAKLALTAGSWAQFRYSARHNGTNPYENVLSPRTWPG
jgi:hypothetical protein